MTRVCTKCNKEKHIGAFSKSSKAKDGLCPWCKSCMSRSNKELRERQRTIVYNHYGDMCACCGESQIKFLSVDHIYNDGAKFRKALGRQHALGVWWYKWIIDNDFPDYLQLLCMNCNFGKQRNNGVCPHKEL